MDSIDRSREEDIADWLIEDIPDLDINSDVSDDDEGKLQPQNGKLALGLDLSSNSLHNTVRNVIKNNKVEEPEQDSVTGIDQVVVKPQTNNHTNDMPSSSPTEKCKPKPSTSNDDLFPNNFDFIFNQLTTEEISRPNDPIDESNAEIEVDKQSKPRLSTTNTNSDPGNRSKELKVIRKRPNRPNKKNLSPKTENCKKVGPANKSKKVADNKLRKGTKESKKKDEAKQKRDAINTLWKKKDLQTSVPPYDYSTGKKNII